MEAMRRVRADLAARPAGTRSVVLAHAFVAGDGSRVTESESERDISVGGVSIVPTTVFAGVDYVALGHLHGRHTLTASVRYSGSPLAYSFSEADHVKGSWLVDLGADGVAGAEFVQAPVPRRLQRITGDLADLLTDPGLAGHEDAWVQATLTDAERPHEPMERLRRRFPHALQLAWEPAGASRPGAASYRPVAGRSDHDIAVEFLGELRGRPASTAESRLLRDACDACSPDRDLDPADATLFDLEGTG
jgi:exonuclease SbcD